MWILLPCLPVMLFKRLLTGTLAVADLSAKINALCIRIPVHTFLFFSGGFSFCSFIFVITSVEDNSFQSQAISKTTSFATE